MKYLKVPLIICLVAGVCILGFAAIFFFVDYRDNRIKYSLPRCVEQVRFTDGGFGDFIDYHAYYYSTENMSKFASNPYLQRVEAGDLEQLRDYFSHYEQALACCDFKDWYAFDKDVQIKTGDYFYINHQNEMLQYGNYDVYYADMQKRVLYFIHFNI